MELENITLESDKPSIPQLYPDGLSFLNSVFLPLVKEAFSVIFLLQFLGVI